MFSKIGVGGGIVLALLFFFVLVPWHKGHDPKPVNGEEKSILRTWWELGQPTRPVKVTNNVTAQQTVAASATPTSVTTSKPAPAVKPVAPKATHKAPVVAKTTTQPRPQPQSQPQALPQQTTQNRDLAQGFQSAFSQY